MLPWLLGDVPAPLAGVSSGDLHLSLSQSVTELPSREMFITYFSLWLCWAFTAARRHSLVDVRGVYPLVAVLGLLTAVVSLVEHGL